MGEGEATKEEVPAPEPAPVTVEKSVVQPSPADEKVADDSKALTVVEKIADPAKDAKPSGGSADRDVALAQLETEKKISLIKAWEESEKSKAQNKAQKKLSAISSWENTKKADVEAKLKKIEEDLERKKAEYAEKMKNQVAQIHKEAEEKRAHVEAKRGEEVLKVEENAAKYRATGFVPKKILGCFGG